MVLGMFQLLVTRRTSFRRSGHLHTSGQLIAEVLHGRNTEDQSHKQDNYPPANVCIKN